MEVLDRARANILRYHMVQPKQRVIVGVSGGPDSIVLLHILKCLQEELNIHLHTAHLNHMFRGEESAEDARFVKELCDSWGIPCTIAERDVSAFGRTRGFSDEMAARVVRYQFFSEVLEQVDGKKIALGHHADDQAETVLMNIFRGAGLKGLAGIAPVRDNLYIRPLLNVRRREIEQYCQEHGLSFRIDSSNLTTVYRRNKLRHQLIPSLERDYSPGIVPILSRMAEQIRSEDEYLEELANKAYAVVLVATGEKVVELDRVKLVQQPRVLIRRILRLAWQEIRGNKQDLTYDHVEGLVDRLLKAGPEREVELPGFVKARLSYGTVLIRGTSSRQERTRKPSQCYSLSVPGMAKLEDGVKMTSLLLSREELTQSPREYSSGMVALDAEKVTLPLLIRSRRDGDVFVPFGLGKRVKLKKFLIDRKVPRHLRDRIPLVVEKNSGRIIWVAGIRLAHEVAITNNTKKVILLSLENGNDSNT